MRTTICKYFNKAMAGLTAGVVVAGFSLSAHAGVIAYSTLQITNFQITSGQGHIVTTSPNQPVINNATSSRASFDDVPGISASNPTDALLSCVGNCVGIGPNNFSRVSDGDPTRHFARGDAELAGSLLAGGVNAKTVGETQLTSNQGSNAGGEASTSSFFWTIDIEGVMGDITLQFSALGDLLAFSDISGGFAQADFDWGLIVRDVTDSSNGTFVAEYNPEELNQSLAIAGIGQADYSVDQPFSFDITGLQANRRYRLIISHNSDVEAFYRAPAPASLAALGLGLIGLGGMAARRRKAE